MGKRAIVCPLEEMEMEMEMEMGASIYAKDFNVRIMQIIAPAS